MAEQNKKNEGFINLRKIHDIQVGGFVQGLIRDLRSTRIQLEHTLSEALKLKNKNKEEISNLSENPIIEKETKTIEKEQINEIASQNKEEVSLDKTQTNVKTFENENKSFDREKRTFGQNSQRQYQENRPFNLNNRPNQDRPFNQNRPYNQDRLYGDKPFNQDNRQFNQSRQYNQDRSNQDRTFNQNRPFNPNFQKTGFNNQTSFNNQRPFNKPFNSAVSNKVGTGFASSKGNNFKSFIAEEVIPVEPARNFVNKSKFTNKEVSKETEEKKSSARQRNSNKNVFVNNSDGFEEVRMGSRKLVKNKKEKDVFVAPQVEHAIITSENISVKTLSEKTGKSVTEIIKKLFILGIMATINSTINFETAELVASELGVTLELKLEKTFEEKLKDKIAVDSDEESIIRPPVVTVMGHVDHGKTSLLDAIRKTDIVSDEAGGITQKIGAYSIVTGGKKITFIDTPGHAAFTSMRIRGAKVTDVAILVVAADDGVMPQTEEAINHIKAAGVPMIVAINKMDKPTANPEKIKQQLADKGVLSEEWGGDTIFVPISAKIGSGIDKLLETIHLVAEVQELKANPNRMATGVIIEAELDKNRGPVASVLVQNGTLHIGDNFISGLTYGKVRVMYDDKGNVVESAGPSICVSVLGFDEVPNSGDALSVIDEKLSKQVIQERKNKIKEERSLSTSGVSLDDFMSKVNEGKLKSLNIIIKADVQGSAEALVQTLTEIKNDEVRVVSIHSGVGFVTESDVLLAKASSSIIIAFNVKTGPKAAQLAKAEKVQIKDYNIIYNVVDDLTAVISGMQTIKYEQVVIGHAEVRAMFKLSSVGFVVGCYIMDGKVTRNSFVRVYRGNELICENQIESLKIVKDEKAEVAKGFECGIKIKEGNLVQVDDKLEFYENVPIKNK